MPVTYSQFLKRYPLFNDPTYGTEASYNNALIVAELNILLLEKTGLNFHTWRNQALEYQTACLLQKDLEAKISSTNQINQLTGTVPQTEKRITVEGEYTIEYAVPSESSKNSSKTASSPYYCTQFESLKELLTDLNIGDGILYSEEF